MANSINSGYLPNGAVQTTTDVPGLGLQGGTSQSYGVGGFPQIPTLNPQYIDFLSQRKLQAQDEEANRKRQLFAMQLKAMQPERNEASPQSKFETPWYSYQGAATRPVGLGAQMIPGMQADPNLLPPSMRPSQSTSSYAPSAVYDQQLQADDEQGFGRQVGVDRARTRSQSEVGGGQPDPYKKLAQQQQNAMYGR